AVDNQGIRDI
ncbi:hypothetical protein Tco_0263834, partial [Tanacetum coccineum]